MKKKGITRWTVVITFLIALGVSLVLASCSNAHTFKGDFALGSSFDLGNMEYTITSIDPPKSQSVSSSVSVSIGVMYVNVDCKALKDGAEPNLSKMLTIRDSTGHEVNQSSVYSSDIYMESSVGKLGKGQQSNYTILYFYDKDQPWYEINLHDNTRSEKQLGSFKFSFGSDGGQAVQADQ